MRHVAIKGLRFLLNLQLLPYVLNLELYSQLGIAVKAQFGVKMA